MGDADGKSDVARNGDKLFASEIGIRFYSPRKFFDTVYKALLFDINKGI